MMPFIHSFNIPTFNMVNSNSLVWIFPVLGFLVLGVSVNFVDCKWVLVFQDEFDKGKISDRWKVDEQCSGNGNNELQCYTARRDNLRMEKGKLIIEAKRERYGDGGKTGGDKDFTSAKISSKANWLHGLFEVRARMPKGKHLWPAIWMMPADSAYGTWPRSGEMDITEYRGQRPQQILGTLHFGEAWNNKGDAGTGERNFNFDFSQEFHTFGFDWNRDRVQWLVDGKVYHEETLKRNFWPSLYKENGQPFDKTFYIIFNLAVGGAFFGNEPFDPKEADGWAKRTLEIDWVKKWEWR